MKTFIIFSLFCYTVFIQAQSGSHTAQHSFFAGAGMLFAKPEPSYKVSHELDWALGGSFQLGRLSGFSFNADLSIYRQHFNQHKNSANCNYRDSYSYTYLGATPYMIMDTHRIKPKVGLMLSTPVYTYYSEVISCENGGGNEREEGSFFSGNLRYGLSGGLEIGLFSNWQLDMTTDYDFHTGTPFAQLALRYRW